MTIYDVRTLTYIHSSPAEDDKKTIIIIIIIYAIKYKVRAIHSQNRSRETSNNKAELAVINVLICTIISEDESMNG